MAGVEGGQGPTQVHHLAEHPGEAPARPRHVPRVQVRAGATRGDTMAAPDYIRVEPLLHGHLGHLPVQGPLHREGQTRNAQSQIKTF